MLSLYLLAAHMVGDYILQSDYVAANKLSNWKVRVWHVLLYTLCFIPIVFLLGLNWSDSMWYLAAIWLTHFIIDSRRWVSPIPWAPKPIMVDQTLHVLTLALITGYFSGFRL